MLNFRIPPSTVAFRLVFEEFCRAYPLGLDPYRKGPFRNDATRKAVEYLAGLLEKQHPSYMLHEFTQRLETIPGARVILVHDERGPLEVSPGILQWVEVEPATYGIFAFPPLATERHPIGREYHLATMYLPADVAEAVRQTWPKLQTVHRVPFTLPDLDEGGSQAETLSEGAAVRIIVAAYDRGEIRTRADARQLIGGALRKNAFDRVCDRVKGQRPEAFPVGRPRRDVD